MGQIENMLPEDVERFTELAHELEKANSNLKFKTFPMEDLELAKRMTKMEEKLASLSAKIDRIFGESILINGRFVDISISPNP